VVKNIKENIRNIQMKKIFLLFRNIFIVAVLLSLLKPAIGNYILKRQGICKIALLTREKTRVRYHRSTLVYKFQLEGEKYTGNSNIEDWEQAGNDVCIVYLASFPSINRPVSFFKQEVKCNCK
jgi:hypothetical protein